MTVDVFPVNTPLRVVQVGLVDWGRDWAWRVIPAVDEVELVAYVDSDPRALALLERKLPGSAARGFQSLDEALEATRPDAVTVALFEATWPLLIPIETDAPSLQAAFDEVICTFQAPSNVAAADGAAKPSAASSEAAIRDFQDLAMTRPFGLDAVKVSQRFHDGCDCRHAPEHDDRAQRKAPRCGGASVERAVVLAVS